MGESPAVNTACYKFVPKSYESPYDKCLLGLMGEISEADRQWVCIRYKNEYLKTAKNEYVVDKKRLLSLFVFVRTEREQIGECVCGVEIKNVCYYMYLPKMGGKISEVMIGMCCNNKWKSNDIQLYQYHNKTGLFSLENKNSFVYICKYCNGNRSVNKNHENCAGKKHLKTVFEALHNLALNNPENLKFTFGKYNGCRVKDVCETDDKYIRWISSQEWFRFGYKKLWAIIVKNVK